MRGVRCGPIALASVVALAPIARAEAQGGYTLRVHASSNPIGPGQCTSVWAELHDASGERTTRLPDGAPLDSRAIVYTLSDSVAFHRRPGAQPSDPIMCARATASGPASTLVTATIQGTTLVGATTLALRYEGGTAGAPVVTAAAPAPFPPSQGAAEPWAADPTWSPATSASAAPPPPAATPPSAAPRPASAPAAGTVAPQPAAPAPSPPSPGGLLARIKAAAKQVVRERVRGADSSMMLAAGGVMGAAGAAVGRGTDAAIGAAAGLVEKGVGAVEGGVRGLVVGGDQRKIAEELGKGRVVLPEIRFVGQTPELDPSSDEPLKALAAALKAATGVFLVESHTDPGGDPAGDQRLSEVRAAVVKAKLVAAGVPAERLAAVGFGSSRPNPGLPGQARVEVLRMQ